MEPRSTLTLGRPKLALTVLLPLFAFTVIAVIFLPRNQTEPSSAASHSPTDAPAADSGGPEAADEATEPEPDAPPEIAVREPVPVPEIIPPPPPALPEQADLPEPPPLPTPVTTPPVATAPEPPPSPLPAPLQPDPEEGLVAAVPNTPGAAPPRAPTTQTGVDANGQYRIHVVERGETLNKIAMLHGLDVATIKQANNLQSDLLHVGQPLRIPGTAKARDLEQPPAIPTPAPPAESAEPAEPTGPAAPLRRHTVVHGDTLTRIARQYDCEIGDIKRLNGLKNDVIHLGAELLIPPAAP